MHSLKIITALVFLATFTCQTFYKAFIVFDYAANTAAYAKNCENKSRPKMHCNGKCQMMKKLKEQEKKDAQNPDRKSENKNENILSSKSFFTNDLATFSPIEKKEFPRLPVAKEIKIARSIFHPPGHC
ncbi:MAG: hypothetical protein U0T68_12885 [Ferruginibacter sp.]